MLFWILLVLGRLSLISIIWGLIASKKIATVETSSEGFADETSVLVDTKEVELDISDGKIGICRKFFYAKKASASASIKYSTGDMTRVLQSDDPKLRLAVSAVIAGLLGVFIFPGLAFISNGGNQAYIGIGIIVFGALGLRSFLNSIINAIKSK